MAKIPWAVLAVIVVLPAAPGAGESPSCVQPANVCELPPRAQPGGGNCSEEGATDCALPEERPCPSFTGCFLTECDPTQGGCVARPNPDPACATAPPTCNTGCTSPTQCYVRPDDWVESCTATGQCPDGYRQALDCDDRDPCTLDTCTLGCEHTTYVPCCNDGDPCTDDRIECGPDAPGCVHESNDLDGDGLCRGGDRCPDDPENACGRHFLCYDVGRPPFAGVDVGLVDDLGSSTVEVRRPKLLCAPVNKNDEDPDAPDDPRHFVGYEVRRDAPFAGVADTVVVDQFGTLVVDLGRPDRLLVPTAKGLTDPVPPLAPGVLDHYQCYRVRGARRRVPEIRVEDQFGAGVTAVKRPRWLCLPVDKNGEGVGEPEVRLMCYRTKPGPRVNQDVRFNNQLGSGGLRVRRARELCVPVTSVPPF